MAQRTLDYLELFYPTQHSQLAQQFKCELEGLKLGLERAKVLLAEAFGAEYEAFNKARFEKLMKDVAADEE